MILVVLSNQEVLGLWLEIRLRLPEILIQDLVLLEKSQLHSLFYVAFIVAYVKLHKSNLTHKHTGQNVGLKSLVACGCEVVMVMLMMQPLPFQWCAVWTWFTAVVKYGFWLNAVSTIRIAVPAKLSKLRHYRYRLWCDEAVIHRCKHWHGNLFWEPNVKAWLQAMNGN